MRNLSSGALLCALLIISIIAWGGLGRAAETAEEAAQVAAEKKLAGMAPATPEPVTNKDVPITLAADQLSYNEEEQSYEAKGDVVLRQADVELRSEELLWQSSTQDAAARGEVLLNDADVSFSGDSMQYNMSTGQG
ncbi:MAG: LPS export ABC transporter periplasmic protein LptC, partial [Deltaproteobacteria bacterium]|nr:LPS export ABC transporter periplasmic protein LptC [Deltaproteobacteria bacterium]